MKDRWWDRVLGVRFGGLGLDQVWVGGWAEVELSRQ